MVSYNHPQFFTQIILAKLLFYVFSFGSSKLYYLIMSCVLQEESLETRMNNFKNVMQEDYNEQLRTTAEWKSTAEKNMTGMKEILNGKILKIRNVSNLTKNN